ncbi:MAG: hypothetical protein L0241_12200 [Planctomycetia bacterium]|nr:hypothetical protein [Planctomycetia bacterium]
MFAEGQRVEITDGPFIEQTGVVVSHEEAERQFPGTAANAIPPNVVLVVVIFWGRGVLLQLTPNQIRATEGAEQRE